MDDGNSSDGKPIILLFSDEAEHIKNFISMAKSRFNVWTVDYSKLDGEIAFRDLGEQSRQEIDKIGIILSVAKAARTYPNSILFILNCPTRVSDSIRELDYDAFAIYIGSVAEAEYIHYDKIQKYEEGMFFSDAIKILNVLTKPIAEWKEIYDGNSART